MVKILWQSAVVPGNSLEEEVKLHVQLGTQNADTERSSTNKGFCWTKPHDQSWPPFVITCQISVWMEGWGRVPTVVVLGLWCWCGTTWWPETACRNPEPHEQCMVWHTQPNCCNFEVKHPRCVDQITVKHNLYLLWVVYKSINNYMFRPLYFPSAHSYDICGVQSPQHNSHELTFTEQNRIQQY